MRQIHLKRGQFTGIQLARHKIGDRDAERQDGGSPEGRIKTMKHQPYPTIMCHKFTIVRHARCYYNRFDFQYGFQTHSLPLFQAPKGWVVVSIRRCLQYEVAPFVLVEGMVEVVQRKHKQLDAALAMQIDGLVARPIDLHVG